MGKIVLSKLIYTYKFLYKKKIEISISPVKNHKTMALLAEIITSYSDENGDLKDVPREQFISALEELRKPRKETKKKSKSGPKRPKSSYMYWLGENRTSIRETYFKDYDEIEDWDFDSKTKYYESKGLDEPKKDGKPKIVTLITSKAGKIWKSLDSSEQEEFKIMAEEAKDKYKLEKDAFDEKCGDDDIIIDDVPITPSDWNGPFKNKYIEKNIKDANGATIKQFKRFEDAVNMANSLEDKCYGITKNKRGYSVRIGELKDTPAEKPGNGEMSWTKQNFNGVLKSKRGRRKGKESVEHSDDGTDIMSAETESVIEENPNDDAEMEVSPLEYDGKEYYLNDDTKDVYDPETGDKVGVYDGSEISFQ